MMEKGLQAVYSGYIAGNGTTISKSKKEGIHGMQWSVSASVGAAYRFYGDWSLYFEPRFSHYFDCDQPASIRTDKPLGIWVERRYTICFLMIKSIIIMRKLFLLGVCL